MCANYWGKGDTPASAVKEMLRQGGNTKSYAVYALPEGATDVTVDAFGGMRWTWTEDADRDGQPVEVAAVNLNR